MSGAVAAPWLATRWELRTLAGTRPWLTDLLVRRSGNRISDETEVVIEGFPRTGNTFAVVAFAQAQPRVVSIAHHVHLPSMAMRAASQGIPCVVLVRDPEDTVLSLVVRLPELSVRQALRSYVRFYEPLLPLRRRFVVATFDQITSDFGAVIDRLNERYGTDFARFQHTPENVERVFGEVDRWDRGAFRQDASVFERSRARPVAGRDALKAARRQDYDADRLWSLRLRAGAVHQAFEAAATEE
jgi:hypothetical protein